MFVVVLLCCVRLYVFSCVLLCAVLKCGCVLCVAYRVELRALLFLCELDVIVWFGCALVCVGVWCVRLCVLLCVAGAGCLLCSNMFVCFVWDVLCDDAWFVFVFVFVCFVQCVCVWCLWNIV